MAARKRKKNCAGCGAEFQGSPASCPLCGAFVGTPPPSVGEKVARDRTVEDYHADLRRLREQLDEIRRESA